MKKASITAIVGIFLLALGTSTSASASSSEERNAPPQDNQPDRVIYVDHPAPQAKQETSSGEKGEVYVADLGEFPVIPEEGEAVRIIYTDAVTDISTTVPVDATAAASCTHSVTVNTPYKTSNRARVSGSAMRSSGCSGNLGFTLRLYGANFERANGHTTVLPNGGNFGLGIVAGPCASTSQMGFYGIGTLAGGGGSTWGPSANLSCFYN